jgi:protein-disulfide isomerase
LEPDRRLILFCYEKEDGMNLTVPIRSNDHVLGGEEAIFTLVEYGDYQCPYSARAHAAVQDLRERLGGRLRFVYRHLPLTERHPYAEMAAEAAEAAAAQGRFWDMHDALYQHQSELSPTFLLGLAASLELDVDRLCADMKSGRFRERVDNDAADATHNGAQETPTFFINGEKHEGDTDEESLAAALMAHVA